ncbi:peptide-methionine (R)-S-oxide reductase [Palleronia marisminoris]|uniref:peptide-methionine (R)-S-oxide reductase n=1 Tax=Palleronia marisminoris TaxID=315423 RepID=A0A1Y5RR29_9RHOB|nr:peptide-methionine (R)-S-oxide reductase MsrB [Palleronia marisminoris]SFG54681.1 peptide-methionine (R)-S-oxide reductase [Palleronia marisminoris]SLN22964.1 Peptide methionine sulfoxide reductase MsrB [Palleronia marisminoris]
MDRRMFLTTTTAFALAAPMARAAAGFEVSLSEAEWRKRLTDAEYTVMREMGTERAFSSPLNEIKASGTYHCKGCDQALYSSETKFESGTGWPSFWAPLQNAVGTKPDRGLFTTRTEVHCDRCGSHMGHVFDDGPQPTGQRYCMNGIAMRFEPAGSGEALAG